MRPSIGAEFWHELAELDAASEIRLALAWIMTNPALNFAGVFPLGRARFRLETGLEANWLDEALRTPPFAERFFVTEGQLLIRDFIWREWCPDREWEKLIRSNIGKGLIGKIPKLLGPGMQAEVYRLYPVLKPLARGLQAPSSPSLQQQTLTPLQAPSSPLEAPSETNEDGPGNGVSPFGPGPDPAGNPEAPYKPLPRGRSRSKSRDSTEEGDARGNSVESSEPGPEGRAKLRYDLARGVLEFLNKKTGAKFPESQPFLYEIALRLHEVNYDVPGIEKMVARQVVLWGDDPRMRQFLRPQTLFEAAKFHGYFGQRDLPSDGAGADVATQRRELEERIARSRANGQSRFHSPDATPEEKAELKKWRGELAGLDKNHRGDAETRRKEA